MKVCIITEGGKKMGFGHITRCSSIYQAFNEIGIIPQFIVNGDESIQNLLNDINHETFDWIDNQKKLLATLSDADIVFVDSYYADYNLYKEISNEVETAVYLDDNMRLEYPKGFVLNGAIFAEQLPYPEKKDVDYMLGVQFAPLRKEFWDVPAKPIRDNIETVMITFGGADTHGLTPKVLEMLINTYPELLKKVIIGSCFQNITEVEKLEGNNTELIYCPGAAKMKAIMFESDIAISAGGQTLYELARVGIPTIGICVAENQLQNIEGWRKSGFLEYIGQHSDKNLQERIPEAINKLIPYKERYMRGKRGRMCVDGSGSAKVVGRILQGDSIKTPKLL